MRNFKVSSPISSTDMGNFSMDGAGALKSYWKEQHSYYFSTCTREFDLRLLDDLFLFGKWKINWTHGISRTISNMWFPSKLLTSGKTSFWTLNLKDMISIKVFNLGQNKFFNPRWKFDKLLFGGQHQKVSFKHQLMSMNPSHYFESAWIPQILWGRTSFWNKNLKDTWFPSKFLILGKTSFWTLHGNLTNCCLEANIKKFHPNIN